MRAAAKTLDEIRSDACNTILVTFTLLAVPAVAASLLRIVEQGWQPIMAAHLSLLLVIAVATFRRRSLSLTARAFVVTAVPYLVAVGGMITYGRGNGVVLFFMSACIIAGVFFGRKVALWVVGLCVLTLIALYSAFRLDLMAFPMDPDALVLTPLSWVTFMAGFIAAVAAPLIGLSALIQSLDAERLRADEAVRVRTDFLANMSHELRTPMAGIIGMAGVLKSTPLDDRQHGLLASLMESGRRLLAMLNDLLDFSKFETGDIPIYPQPFRVSDMVRTACAGPRDAAARKGLTFNVEMPVKLHDGVIGDGLRLGQVLTNLADNAVKFTERGCVVVRVEQEAGPDGKLMLTCRVSDTGIGIAPELTAAIFDPFIQADMSTSRVHGGSGLGLSICRSLVEAMGGSMGVSSNPSEGSTFSFSVPLALQEVEGTLPAAPSSQRSQSAEEAPNGAVSPLSILVADDDPNMRTLAEIMLSRRGHHLTIVDDGGAALEAARSRHFDCILLDMHMPVVDGREVLRRLRASEASAGAARRNPMIALTADIVPESARRFLDAGADAVVGKPVDWDKLEAKMFELVSEGAAAGIEPNQERTA